MKNVIEAIKQQIPVANPWVMQSSQKQLIAMVGNMLRQLDDATQFAADAGQNDLANQLAGGYHELEEFHVYIKKRKFTRPFVRNQIRMTMKHYVKLCARIENSDYEGIGMEDISAGARLWKNTSIQAVNKNPRKFNDR